MYSAVPAILVLWFVPQSESILQHVLHGHRVRAVCPNDPEPWPQERLSPLNLGEDGDWEGIPEAHEWFENPYFLARLQQLQLYEPARPAPPYDISMVSALSLARLDALSRQCSTWAGTISAALYIPIISTGDERYRVEPSHAYSHPFLEAGNLTLQAIVGYVAGVHAATESGGRCRLLMSLWVEELPEGYWDVAVNFMWDFPINSIRNRAMLQAPTEIVILADVDFVAGPTAENERIVNEQEAYEQMREVLRNGAVASFASFQPQGDSPHEVMKAVYVAQTKAEIVAMFESGSLDVFQSSNHQHTDYGRWGTANETYDIEYTCWHVNVNAYYEPFVMGWRDLLPLWDERYRGYHANKNVWMVDLIALYQYPLRVVPNLYLVHAPHSHTAGMSPWNTRFIHVKRYYLKEACAEGAKGDEYPFVLLEAGEEACRQRATSRRRSTMAQGSLRIAPVHHVQGHLRGARRAVLGSNLGSSAVVAKHAT